MIQLTDEPHISDLQDHDIKAATRAIVQSVLRARAEELPHDVLAARSRLVLECSKVIGANGERP